MIAGIFTALGNYATLYLGFFGDMLAAVIGLFWVEASEGVAGHLTIFGEFTILGIVIGVTWGIIALVRRLVKMRG